MQVGSCYLQPMILVRDGILTVVVGRESYHRGHRDNVINLLFVLTGMAWVYTSTD